MEPAEEKRWELAEKIYVGWLTVDARGTDEKTVARCFMLADMFLKHVPVSR